MQTEKVLWILKRLSQPPFEMSLIELAKELGMVKSGVYKILTAMVREDFITHNTDRKKYHLGSALYRLGNVYSARYGIGQIVMPVMKKINAETNETVSITLLEGLQPTLAFRVESTHELRLHGTIGKKYPLNGAAMAKVLGAYWPAEQLDNYLRQHPLEKKTEHSISDPDILKAEFAKVREQGYAISDEEGSKGAMGVAAPIYNHEGHVFAALGIGGPKNRIDSEVIRHWLDLIISGAKEISYKLGYRR